MSPTPQRRPFLTSHWLNLLMLNYEVEPAVLTPYLPYDTELDEWNGQTLVSVVGLQFRDTRLLGIPIPFHRNFDEVNLRFYVRRRVGQEWRRGVVFIREVVSRPAITAVARLSYNEAYVTLPMRSDIRPSSQIGRFRYAWRQGRWNRLEAKTSGPPQPYEPGSLEEFITEHFYGYVRLPGASSLEYEVRHPKWRLWPVVSANLDCDISTMYGPQFKPYLEAPPHSALVAEGSEVEVYPGICFNG